MHLIMSGESIKRIRVYVSVVANSVRIYSVETQILKQKKLIRTYECRFHLSIHTNSILYKTQITRGQEYENCKTLFHSFIRVNRYQILRCSKTKVSKELQKLCRDEKECNYRSIDKKPLFDQTMHYVSRQCQPVHQKTSLIKN